MHRSLTRRHLVITSIASGIALAGSRPAGLLAQPGTPGASPAAVVTDTFPVTIPHVYGETEIPTPPTRVAALAAQ